MVKKTTKTAQQRTKEDQWRRRAAAQAQTATPTLSNTAVDDAVEDDEQSGYIQADMRKAPNVATQAAATRIAATGAARSTATSPATAAAAQRRALAAARSARSRMPINALSVEDEMGYVRSDVRSLVILTAICLAVIIVLSFIIK